MAETWVSVRLPTIIQPMVLTIDDCKNLCLRESLSVEINVWSSLKIVVETLIVAHNEHSYN